MIAEAFSWPLFLHVLGAMLLVGAVLSVIIVACAGWRRPGAPALRRSAFWALLAVAVPAWVVTRVFAQLIYADEKSGFGGHDPAWVKIGFDVADGGLIVLLLALGASFWWWRGGRPLANRILTGLSSVYLVLLTVALLAMSGKWH